MLRRGARRERSHPLAQETTATRRRAGHTRRRARPLGLHRRSHSGINLSAPCPCDALPARPIASDEGNEAQTVRYKLHCRRHYPHSRCLYGVGTCRQPSPGERQERARKRTNGGREPSGRIRPLCVVPNYVKFLYQLQSWLALGPGGSSHSFKLARNPRVAVHRSEAGGR